MVIRSDTRRKYLFIRNWHWAFNTANASVHKRNGPYLDEIMPSNSDYMKLVNSVYAGILEKEGNTRALRYVFKDPFRGIGDAVAASVPLSDQIIVNSCGKLVSLSAPSFLIRHVSSILIPPIPGRYTPGSAETMFPARRICSDLAYTEMS
jgi:hypothetical protein